MNNTSWVNLERKDCNVKIMFSSRWGSWGRRTRKGIKRKRSTRIHRLFIGRNPARIMFHSFIMIAAFGAVCIFVQGQQTGDENCETLPFQLHLIKGLYWWLLDWQWINFDLFQRSTMNSADCKELAMVKWRWANAKVFAIAKFSPASSHRPGFSRNATAAVSRS